MELKEVLINAGLTDLKDFGNGTWRTKAIWRNGNNLTSVCINKETGQFYDFVSATGGNLEQLLKLLNKEINIDDIELVKKEPTIKTQKIYDKFVLNKLVSDYTYWNQRGISNEIIKLFEGGICESGKMAKRWILPIYNDKLQLVGATGRYLYELNDFIPKWKHNFKVSEVIYPIHLSKQEIINKREIILVESPANCISLFELGIKNVLVLFGTKLHKILIQFILKHNIQKIILILDNDIDNKLVGNKASEEIKNKLLHYFDQNQIVNLTNLVQFKDLNQWLQKDKNSLIDFCKNNLTID